MGVIGGSVRAASDSMAFQVDRVCRKLTANVSAILARARARTYKFRNDVVDELSEPNVSHFAVVAFFAPSSLSRPPPSLRLKARDSLCLSAFPFPRFPVRKPLLSTDRRVPSLSSARISPATSRTRDVFGSPKLPRQLVSVRHDPAISWSSWKLRGASSG